MPLLHLSGYIKMDSSLCSPKTQGWVKQRRAGVGSSAHPAKRQQADFRHAARFPRNIFYLEVVISDTPIQLSHLAFLPFHHGIELGFQVNNAGFWVTQQLLRFGEGVLSPHFFSCFALSSLSPLPPPPPASPTSLPHQKLLLSLSCPKETLPLFNCLNK